MSINSRSQENSALSGTIKAMTARTRRMMRRSKPRVRESRILAGTVSIVWSTVALVLLAALAIGLGLYLPGTNAL